MQQINGSDLAGGTALKIVVAGAGTMGAGIAAHLANLGHSVTLIDTTIEQAVRGLDRKKEVTPPAFFGPEAISKITPVGIESLESSLEDADWFCEAIIEKLEPKRALLAAAAPFIKEKTFVSTNTSGIPIGLLAEGLPAEFQKKFVGTHFFNPPRYLKLLELIPSEYSDPEVIEDLRRLLEGRLARRVVIAKDTPGFIANRLGMWAMYKAIHTTEKLGLTIEDADEITGPFLGRPRSASFRLNDLVGLDIMQDIASNLLDRCPHDPMISALQPPQSLKSLLSMGRLGTKSGQGYYRKEGKDILALDLTTFVYRPLQGASFELPEGWKKQTVGQRVSSALQSRGEIGEFLREYLVPTLRYAHSIREEISNSVLDVDRVMQWGFGWSTGPFELIDELGAENLGIESKKFFTSGNVLDLSGEAYHPAPSEPDFASINDFPVTDSTDVLNIRDAGDGIKILGIKTKMGSISPKLVHDLTEWLSSSADKGVVLTSEGPAFSVGYDLNVFKSAIESGDFDSIESNLKHLQDLGILLESRNAVAAIQGYCLGGGLELALSCPIAVAQVESKLGLPESRVGLLPGGRGTLLLARRTDGTPKALADAAITVCRGTIFPNAVQAASAGFFRQEDILEAHPDKVLTTAVKAAVSGAKTAVPAWTTAAGPVSGMIDRQVGELKSKGEFTNHDGVIAEKVKQVIAKATSLEDALERERKGFVDLCRSPLTLARIKFMLESGKPLRN